VNGSPFVHVALPVFSLNDPGGRPAMIGRSKVAPACGKPHPPAAGSSPFEGAGGELPSAAAAGLRSGSADPQAITLALATTSAPQKTGRGREGFIRRVQGLTVDPSIQVR
jgi:hypothetical protein